MWLIVCVVYVVNSMCTVCGEQYVVNSMCTVCGEQYLYVYSMWGIVCVLGSNTCVAE